MTALVGPLLVFIGVGLGLRLLLGLDERGTAFRRLGGLAILALALPILAGALQNALTGPLGGTGLALILAVIGCLVVIGYLSGRPRRPAGGERAERPKPRERIGAPPVNPGGAP